jgi:hypothetical protein
MKAAIAGADRSTAPKHVPRYLAEFRYRFNRRYSFAAMLPRLAEAALQAPPTPYRLLKLAGAAAQSAHLLRVELEQLLVYAICG